jgi:hypothetical protein
MGGIEVDGVGRLWQRRLGAGAAVALVAVGDVARDADRVARQASAARSPGAGLPAEASRKIFTSALGKTLVAMSRPSMTTLWRAPKARCSTSARRTPAHGGHLRGGGGDLRGADSAGDVFAIEEHALGSQIDVGRDGELRTIELVVIGGSLPLAHRATARYMAPVSM